MAGLTDSVTIGIVLTLIFGAVAFYLYSRLAQNEKRVGLLENLLMTLKLSTEASLLGPEFVEPISNPAALDTNDVEEVSEGDYADLLKDLSAVPATQRAPTPVPAVVEELKEGEEEEKPRARTVDVNYESMSLKELNALAKERGLSGVPNRKRDLIDALKKQGDAVPTAPVPLVPAADDLEGVSNGFTVSLENA
jgi:hypothetical protein